MISLKYKLKKEVVMGIWAMLILLIVCFAGFIIVKQLWDRNGIFTLGICGAIGANVYNSSTYPISEFGIIFGADSIIYTIFVFCVLVLIAEKKPKAPTVLLYSTIGAIFFNAVLQLLSTIGSTGTIDFETFYGALSCCASAVATWCAIVIAIRLFKSFHQSNFNIYLNFAVCILVASFINSFIYFGAIAIISGNFDTTFLPSLVGSYLGKFASTAFALIAWYIVKTLDKRKAQKLNDTPSLKQNNISTSNIESTQTADKNAKLETTKTKKTTTSKSQKTETAKKKKSENSTVKPTSNKTK